MAYDSRLTGRLGIDPPLAWSQVRESPLRKPEPPAGVQTSLVLREQVVTTDTDTGRVQTITATAVEPSTTEQISHYGLENELTALAQAYGADHDFSGYLVRWGAEQGDVQRYTIREGTMVTETATLTWPDGTTVVE